MDLDLAATLESDLLAASIDALTPLDGSDPRVGAPSLTFVGHTTPAADCDLLSVHSNGWTFETGESCLVIPTLELVVTLWRCWPSVDGNGNPPSGPVITAAALDLAVDGQALVRELGRARLNGTLFPTANMGCTNVSFVDVTPLAPAGGLAGWTVTILVSGAP